MSWGVAHGWINTVLLLLVGLFVLLTGRWKHLKWFPVYALAVSGLTFFQLLCAYSLDFSQILWINVVDFFHTKRLVGELLCLGAVVEVIRKEARKQPFWPWFALLGLVIIPFLPIDPFAKYYLPYDIFALGLALEMGTALIVKSAPLLAWSVIGAATVVSDSLKFLIPWPEVSAVLVFLDPWFFTAMCGILLGGLFWEEIEKYILPVTQAFTNKLWQPVFVDAADKRRIGPADAKSVATPEYELKARIGVGNGEEKGKYEASDKWDSSIEEILMRLEALEDIVRYTVEASPKVRKMFLSPVDLAIYLGTTEELARRFVEEHNLSKIPLSDKPDEWLVFRAEVEDALEEPEDPDFNDIH
jgi:hypothetical protein